MEMTQSSLINDLKQKFSIKRNSAIFESEKNKQLALSNPEYYVLDKQKRQLVFEKGKLLFENKSTDIIDKKIEEINAKQAEILKSINVDENLLYPQFECKKCEDKGFVDGKMCSCFNKCLNKILMEKSNINFDLVDSLEKYNFSNFDADKQNQIKPIVENLKIFVDNFDKSLIKNIVFTGATGVGKTYLSQSVAKSLIEKGYSCLFLSAFNLNNSFLKMHTSSNEDKLALLDTFLNPDLIIIDDLGTEPMLKNVTKEYLQLLLNERVLLNKVTIITTNLLPNEIIDKYNERIFSRLFNKANSALFLLSGKDLRINN